MLSAVPDAVATVPPPSGLRFILVEKLALKIGFLSLSKTNAKGFSEEVAPML